MINKPLKIIAQLAGIGAGIALLAGCTPHLTLQQCQTMNWYQVGVSDGQVGNARRNLQQDIADCAKYKLTVNTGAYARGYVAGTRIYCQPSNALKLGTAGQGYRHVCPANMAPAFERAWRQGLKRYCVPGTGYNLGRSGKSMPTFCAPDQAVAFSNAYNDGARLFQNQQRLQGELNATKNAMKNTNNQIKQQRKNIRNWQNRLDSGLPNIQGPAAKQAKRRELRNNIRNANNRIRELEMQLNRQSMRRNQLQRQYTKAAAR